MGRSRLQTQALGWELWETGYIPWSLKIAHPFVFHKQVSRDGRLGLRICSLPEKFYPCLRDFCTGFAVLGCLRRVSWGVAWCLRQQGCREHRAPRFQPASGTKECSVPRSATKSAHRTGRWWPYQCGGHTGHCCSSPLQWQLLPYSGFLFLLTLPKAELPIILSLSQL